MNRVELAKNFFGNMVTMGVEKARHPVATISSIIGAVRGVFQPKEQVVANERTFYTCRRQNANGFRAVLREDQSVMRSSEVVPLQTGFAVNESVPQNETIRVITPPPSVNLQVAVPVDLQVPADAEGQVLAVVTEAAQDVTPVDSQVAAPVVEEPQVSQLPKESRFVKLFDAAYGFWNVETTEDKCLALPRLVFLIVGWIAIPFMWVACWAMDKLAARSSLDNQRIQIITPAISTDSIISTIPVISTI